MAISIIDDFDKRLMQAVHQSLGRNLPNHIYHYTNTDALISILNNKVLRATHAEFLNDPHEITHPFRNFQEKAAKALHTMPGNYVELVTQTIFKDLQPRIFITSFSVLHDAQSIWRQYGKADGYNIKLLTAPLMSSANICIKQISPLHANTKSTTIESSAFILPVVYDQAQQEYLTNFFVGELALSAELVATNKIEATEFNAIQNHIMRQAIARLTSFKSASYQHEEEVRLAIVPLSLINIQRYSALEGIVRPHIEYSINNMLPIEGITIGPKITSSIAREGIIRICQSNNWNIDVESIEYSSAGIRF